MATDFPRLCERARAASRAMAIADAAEKNAALEAAASALVANAEKIAAENAADVASARERGTKEALVDRLVLDLHKGGPLHPILALGLGAVNIGKQNDVNGWAVAGLGRIGLEYSLMLEDADVRIGAGVTGALLGPSDDSISSARAFAMFNATFSIGF